MTVRNRKKTIFASREAIKNETPMWAKVVFRLALYISAGVNIWVASTALINDAHKVEVMLVMNAFVLPGIHMLSKMFGLKEKE